MTTQQVHIVGIGDVPADELKTVFARFFPALPAGRRVKREPLTPRAGTRSERLDDAHSEFVV